MKRVLIIIFAGVFILPQVCESFMPIKAEVDKQYGNVKNTDKHIHNSDSVSIDYDVFTSTIMITTAAERKNVRVQIYNKDGMLIYQDKDEVGRGFSLNYVMTDEEAGEYEVAVDVDGGGSVEETVTKE